MSPPLSAYPAPEARDAAARRLGERAGGEVVRLGESAEGRPLLAVRLPALRPGAGGAAAPAVLCVGGIHGLELVGTSVALGLLEGLAAGAFAGLRERAEVWVLPSLNPDGAARTFARGGAGRLGELRTNARGVDLNRNFPLPLGAAPHPWMPAAGSARPGDATYRGPAPLSEPEAQALDALLAARGFHALVSLHSTMGTLIPARVLDRPSRDGYRALCGAFQAAQPHSRYLRLQGGRLDVFAGELEDHAHHARRCWATCVEVYPLLADAALRLRAGTLFERFNPPRPEDWVRNDVPGVAAFFGAALARPRPGAAS